MITAPEKKGATNHLFLLSKKEQNIIPGIRKLDQLEIGYRIAMMALEEAIQSVDEKRIRILDYHYTA